jgi:hypothetical protein
MEIIGRFSVLDRQRLAFGRPELDNIGAVILGAVNHDAIFARHRHRR